MPMPPEIKALLPAKIALERFVGEDQWGNDLYGAKEADIAAFVQSSTLTYGAEGMAGTGAHTNRIVTSYSVITDAIGIKPGDHITLSDGTMVVARQVDAPALDADGVAVMQTTTAVMEKAIL